MASEPRRQCGYRKTGGLYLVADDAGQPCDRLPFPLHVCPTCSTGIKQARGWTWVDLAALSGGPHDGPDAPPDTCRDEQPCPFCDAEIEKAGLLWIGEKFYKTVAEFQKECSRLGISRRISTVPRGFKVGETWVLLAHPKAVPVSHQFAETFGVDACAVQDCGKPQGDDAHKASGGVFRIFKPSKIEIIITEGQSGDDAFMASVKERGLSPVVVPDGDKDHQGSVFDKDEEPEPAPVEA